MSRKDDLEQSIAQANDLIHEYQAELREAESPKARARARREIAQLRGLVEEYQAELRALSGTERGEVDARANGAEAPEARDLEAKRGPPPPTSRTGWGRIKRAVGRLVTSPGWLIPLVGLFVVLCAFSIVIGPLVLGGLPLSDAPIDQAVWRGWPFRRTPTPMPTSTPALPLATATPTLTLVASPPATADQPLVIVADFEDRSDGKYQGIDPAQYVYEQVDQQGRKLGIRVQRVRLTVDDNSVRTVGAAHRATLVLWGWYDALSITPRITPVERLSEHSSSEERRHLALGTLDQIEFCILHDLPSHATYLALFSLAMAEYEHQDYDRALEYLEGARAAIPQGDLHSTVPAEACLYSGNIHYHNQMYARALEDYDKAIELDPGLYQAYYNRGITQLKTPDTEAALADFGKAIELQDTYALAYLARGFLFLGYGRYEEALADYTQAIELEPNIPDNYYNRAIVHERMGESGAALGDYTKAIELDPECSGAYYNRGTVHYELQEYAQALADLSRVLELSPDDDEAYYVRGLTYKALGQVESAVADFGQCLDLTDDPQLRQLATQELDKLSQPSE